MLKAQRPAIAAIISMIVSGEKANSIYDFSKAKYTSLTGQADKGTVYVRDNSRGVYITGYPYFPDKYNLYDYGTRFYVNLEINNFAFSGYDYNTQQYFGGHVNGNHVSLFDYETGEYYAFAASPAILPDSYLTDEQKEKERQALLAAKPNSPPVLNPAGKRPAPDKRMRLEPPEPDYDDLAEESGNDKLTSVPIEPTDKELKKAEKEAAKARKEQEDEEEKARKAKEEQEEKARKAQEAEEEKARKAQEDEEEKARKARESEDIKSSKAQEAEVKAADAQKAKEEAARAKEEARAKKDAEKAARRAEKEAKKADRLMKKALQGLPITDDDIKDAEDLASGADDDIDAEEGENDEESVAESVVPAQNSARLDHAPAEVKKAIDNTEKPASPATAVAAKSNIDNEPAEAPYVSEPLYQTKKALPNELPADIEDRLFEKPIEKPAKSPYNYSPEIGSAKEDFGQYQSPLSNDIPPVTETPTYQNKQQENKLPSDEEIAKMLADMEPEQQENKLPSDEEIAKMLADMEPEQQENKLPSDEEIAKMLADMEPEQQENKLPSDEEIAKMLADMEPKQQENKLPSDEEIAKMLADMEPKQQENKLPSDEEIAKMLADMEPPIEPPADADNDFDDIMAQMQIELDTEKEWGEALTDISSGKHANLKKR